MAAMDILHDSDDLKVAVLKNLRPVRGYLPRIMRTSVAQTLYPDDSSPTPIPNIQLMRALRSLESAGKAKMNDWGLWLKTGPKCSK